MGKSTSGKSVAPPSILRDLIVLIYRGIYCLLTVATLLNLLTPALLDGVPEFLATCQTYEGGFIAIVPPLDDCLSRLV